MAPRGATGSERGGVLLGGLSNRLSKPIGQLHWQGQVAYELSGMLGVIVSRLKVKMLGGTKGK